MPSPKRPKFVDLPITLATREARQEAADRYQARRLARNPMRPREMVLVGTRTTETGPLAKQAKDKTTGERRHDSNLAKARLQGIGVEHEPGPETLEI